MIRLALALLACALLVAACGEDRGSVNVEGSGTGTGSTGSTGATSATGTTTAPAGEADQTITVTADPDGALKWTEEELSAEAGTIKFVLENPSTLPHALEIEGNGVEEETETINQNGTAELTVALEPGEYEYYCPVEGHQEGGMTGTLTIN